MKLEVGMYVRTDIGEIAKIIKEKQYTDKFDNHKYKEMIDDNKLKYAIYDDLSNNHVIKTSHNAVGDYVNGHRVYEIRENGVLVGYKCFVTEFDDSEEFIYQTIYEKILNQ